MLMVSSDAQIKELIAKGRRERAVSLRKFLARFSFAARPTQVVTT